MAALFDLPLPYIGHGSQPAIHSLTLAARCYTTTYYNTSPRWYTTTHYDITPTVIPPHITTPLPCYTTTHSDTSPPVIPPHITTSLPAAIPPHITFLLLLLYCTHSDTFCAAGLLSLSDNCIFLHSQQHPALDPLTLYVLVSMHCP